MTELNTSFAYRMALLAEIAYCSPTEIEKFAVEKGYTKVKIFNNEGSEAFICEGTKNRYLVWRGTDSFASGIQDLEFEQINLPGVEGGHCHRGFWNHFINLWPKLNEYLMSQPNMPLALTAHSLGSICIQYAAFRLYQLGKAPMSVYAFAPPCGLNAIGGKAYDDALKAVTFSVELDCDIVPKAGEHVGLCRIGQPVFIDHFGEVRFHTPQVHDKIKTLMDIGPIEYARKSIEDHRIGNYCNILEVLNDRSNAENDQPQH